jgi:hypothetical protein
LLLITILTLFKVVTSIYYEEDEVSGDQLTEIAKILFQASITLSTILVAVIGILLAEYHSAKKAGLGETTLADYKTVTCVIVGILTASTISSFLFLLFFIGINVFNIAVGLVMLVMITIVALAFVMVLMFMK